MNQTVARIREAARIATQRAQIHTAHALTQLTHEAPSVNNANSDLTTAKWFATCATILTVVADSLADNPTEAQP